MVRKQGKGLVKDDLKTHKFITLKHITIQNMWDKSQPSVVTLNVTDKTRLVLSSTFTYTIVHL